MKKQLSLLITLVLLAMPFGLATPVAQYPLIGDDPIYTESDFAPLVFLNANQGGRVLIDDPYGVLPHNDNGDITVRENNYAFTGEQIKWIVLVWDKNGIPEKISDVFAGWSDQTNGPLDPETQVNCQYLRAVTGNLANQGYPNVRRPGDQEAQINGNADTMGEYICTLTIEPNCHGQKWLGAKAIDLSGLSGTIQEADSWFCNPSMDLSISGNINFGELGPGEQGASTFSVENTGEEGSGILEVLAISGTDFYDPSSSGALCPTSNQLKLQGVNPSQFTTGFWYTATMGIHTVSNKRIPYGNEINEADPIFSPANGHLTADWGSSLVAMSPGSEATMTLHLGIPVPCNGQFTDGDISLWAVAL